MAHEYVKENDTFNTSRNGTVPKPTQEEVTAGKVLKADGTWGEGGGGGTVTDVEVNGQSVVNEQGVAEITMPSPPTIPVEDVEVNGESVVNAQKVAQIKSYKEVTQAEYEALPASKLSDGILYAIKDGGQAVDGFPPLIYSDEEREIGVWKDGKPLYQKTWECTLTSAISGSKTGEYVSLINLPDVSVKKVEAYDSNGAALYPFTGYSSSKGTQLVNFRYLEGYIKLYDVGVPYSAGEVITVTVKYTKNSDTPGSGTWTTQGAIAHHYSTDEHIIGTWIDGKPLYEKTFWLPSRTAITNDYTTIVISDTTAYNIENVINATGYDNNGGEDTDRVRLLTGNIDFILSNTNQLIAYTVSNSTYKLTGFTLQYTKTTD